MAKFRLLQGLHSQGGCTYQPGDVLESSGDLTRHNYPGAKPRFELLEEQPHEKATPVQSLTVEQHSVRKARRRRRGNQNQ